MITSRFACLGHMCQVSCSSSRGKKNHWRDGHHKCRHSITNCKAHSPSTCLWVPRSEKFKQVLEKIMDDVSREGKCRACEPMTDVEQRFDDARSRLRDVTSSTVLQGFNSSSLGELLPHELLVLHVVRRQRRLVAELRIKVVSERKLAALRLHGRKNVNRRLPSSLRNTEGHPVAHDDFRETCVAIKTRSRGQGPGQAGTWHEAGVREGETGSARGEMRG